MLGRHDINPRLKGFAKNLRRQSTDAEQKLWGILRNGQLGGFRFRRQHPVAGYIVDFICLKADLVVELDGGQHLDPADAAYDLERTKQLEGVNLRVLRIPDDEMLKNPDLVVENILRELSKAKNPHPNPLPEYMERGQKEGNR